MKKIGLFIIAALAFQFSFSQNPVRCSTMEADSLLRLQHPGESLQDFENWLQAKIVQYRSSQAYLSGQRSVVTIPIIFHVIHNGDAVGSGENISQAQVNSQIDVLNEDYRKALGTLGYNTNAVGADCEIEFCPAVVDPNGNVLAEPGIDRVNAGESSWAQSDIDATLKPQTIWDPTRYFNVWTVVFGGSSQSLLGYAQFPNTSGLQGINNNNGSATTDGVVILYKACGRVGNLHATYNKGRTLTHESGHFFGLRHIWGDQNCGNDYCDDTPSSSGANYGCPTGQNTCSDAGSDMVQNYMDYTDDDCMNIFTLDQKDRMMTVLNNSPRRSTLTASNVCSIPFTFSYTGKVVDATTNAGIPNAKVFVDGPADYTPTTDANGFFTISNLQQDNYTIYAGKWGYVTNTVASQYYTTGTPQVTIALQPGYYDDALLDFTWTVSGNAGTGIWTRAVPNGTTYNSAQSNPGADVTGDYGNTCYVTGNGGSAAGDDDVDGGTTTLTSPVMNLSTYTNPVLRYYRWFYNGGGTGTPNDSLVISLVNGTQVIDIDKVGQGANSNQWTYKSYRIKDYIANPGSNIKVSFRTFDQNSTGHLVEAGLDLFRVIDSTGSTAQAPVANFGSNATTVCAGQQVSFNDLSSNNPTSWAWTFQGGSPGSSTSANPIITYGTPGTYAVSLTVGNLGGSNSTTQTGYITVAPVVAQFTQDVTGICPGGSVTFTNGTACSPSFIKWVFPGGTPSNSADADPVVTYTGPGFYDVTLIVGNQFGNDTLVQNLSVQVYAPASLGTAVVSDTDNMALGSATVNVSGGVAPYTFSWNDGQHQTTATATGLAAGNYNVTITDGHGCSSITSVAVPNTIVNGIYNLGKSQVKVYPNPIAGGNLVIAVGTASIGRRVELTNALGQLLYSSILRAENTGLNFDNYTPGVYFLKIYGSAGTNTVRVVKE